MIFVSSQIDISFDTCVKDYVRYELFNIFIVMGQYCPLSYFPHYIILYVFVKLKLTLPLQLCVFRENVGTEREAREI